MPREREIVKRTRELLKSAGAKVIKTSGEGEPDLVGVYRGVGFAIECKQVGKQPTPVQAFRIKEWTQAGAVSFWTDFPARALVTLEDAVSRRLKQHIDPEHLALRFQNHYDSPERSSPYWFREQDENGMWFEGFDMVRFFDDYRNGKVK